MHPIEASDSHTKNITLEMDTVTAIIEESGSERPYHVSIAKDHLASLPAVPYNLTPILIDSQEQVEAAVKILREADIIGFDTETKPNFRKGGLNKVALLQLHTRTQGFLFPKIETGSWICVLSQPGTQRGCGNANDRISRLEKRWHTPTICHRRILLDLNAPLHQSGILLLLHVGTQ